MTRIARNTTAIVTCLSMLMPHMAFAETASEDDLARKITETLERKQAYEEEELKRKAAAEKKAAEAKREERRKRQEAKREKRREAQAEKAREAEKEPTEAEREKRRERIEAQREKRREAQAKKAREAEKKAAEATRDERRKRIEAQRERRREAQAEERRVEERRAERRRARSAAAREAAEASRAPEAAALHGLLGSGSGDIIRQVITDRNSRSSDEDFSTSLRDAMSPERNRQEARNDDDDDNDLTKALLLGLGALAVGSMLNNNRQVALSSPDRVVMTRPDGSQEIVRDDVALLRQPGSNVETEQFDDGSSRTVVTRADGSKVVTIRDANMQILRRTLISADGRTSRLIDDTENVRPVDIAALPAPATASNIANSMDEEALRAALNREANIDRRFTLGQIRNIPEVRSLVAPVDIPAITFDTGSSAIPPGQAEQLSALGRVMEERIRENPREIYMVEGYTDTVGDSAMNLALSDRRAESVALALTEYFDVPPENLVVQGYGEDFLKVEEAGDIRDNRRSSVRRITDLLQTASAE